MKKLKADEMNYIIDEAKFIMAINNGETFKTSHGETGIYKQGGSVYFKQVFNYRFDMEFILNNEKKLKELGIIEPKKKRTVITSKL